MKNDICNIKISLVYRKNNKTQFYRTLQLLLLRTKEKKKYANTLTSTL